MTKNGRFDYDKDAREHFTVIRKLASLIKTGEYSSTKNIEMLDEIMSVCEYMMNTYDIVDEMRRA